jgi:hypothetical protein
VQGVRPTPGFEGRLSGVQPLGQILAAVQPLPLVRGKRRDEAAFAGLLEIQQLGEQSVLLIDGSRR